VPDSKYRLLAQTVPSVSQESSDGLADTDLGEPCSGDGLTAPATP
jgi:hypothetical protein